MNFGFYPISNTIINQKLLKEEFGTTHTVEYLSCLWRNKIPKMIASTAEDEYLQWYYLIKEKGKFKISHYEALERLRKLL